MRIDFTPPSGRPFVSMLLQSGDNVALLGVKAGWLRVRSNTNDASEYCLHLTLVCQYNDSDGSLMQQLTSAEQEAQAAKIGQWNDDSAVVGKVP